VFGFRSLVEVSFFVSFLFPLSLVTLCGCYQCTHHGSDRCVTTQSEIFEAEDTRRDRKACVDAKQCAVAGHPSDGENLKTSKTAIDGLVSLVIK
jgi:hypothetical protein